MGYGLEDILKDLKNFEERVQYYLSCLGSEDTEIKDALLELKAKLTREYEKAIQ